MNVKVVIPTSIVFSGDVERFTFEGVDGAHGILPNHIDFVDAVKPGILRIQSHGTEIFIANDIGIIVKQGKKVLISTRNAIPGNGDVGTMRNTVREHFRNMSEHDKQANRVIVRLESEFLRRFVVDGRLF